MLEASSWILSYLQALLIKIFGAKRICGHQLHKGKYHQLRVGCLRLLLQVAWYQAATPARDLHPTAPSSPHPWSHTSGTSLGQGYWGSVSEQPLRLFVAGPWPQVVTPPASGVRDAAALGVPVATASPLWQ